MKEKFAGHIINTDAGDIFVYTDNISEYEYDSVKMNYNIVGEIETTEEVVNLMSNDISDTDNSEIKIGIISDVDDIQSEKAYDAIIEDVNEIMADCFEDDDDDYDDYDDDDEDEFSDY